jgi:uncharacterized protein YndB with AHSA1/START domain
MPTVARRRTIAGPPEELWQVVSDPYHLPRWWPGVLRVEEASAGAWTKVLTTPKRKSVRADYSVVRAEAPRLLTWRQEVEETPFERILSESLTDISLEPDGADTRVELRARLRLRGLSRLGALQIRRATARQLDEALDGLARLAGDSGDRR